MLCHSRDICVAGGGSWGTALAHLAASKGLNVTIFLRDSKVCQAIVRDRENPRYLPGVRLHPGLRADTDPGVLDACAVILAVPCQQQRAFLTAHREAFRKDCLLVNAAKGIELASGRTGSGFIPGLLGLDPERYAVLSGPSFAREVAEGRPAAVAVASVSQATALRVQELLSTAAFRCYAGTDVLGVEVGGAVKNVIAIAAGLCDGLAAGTSGRAALITRGLAEITRLGVALGARPQTFMGLSGLGDLVLTATGDLSRNRQLGLALARGAGADEAARAIGMVTEGAKTAFAVRALAGKLGLDMPVTCAVCDILSGDLAPGDAVSRLMARALTRE